MAIPFLVAASSSIVLVGVIWVISKLVEYYLFIKKLRPLPGRKPHWLMGSLHEVTMLRESVFMRLLQLGYDEKWKVFKFWFGPFPSVTILHPDGLTNILKTPKSEFIYRILEPWLGQGLLIANGKRWYRSRRLLTPAFHYDILKPYVHIYNEATDILLEKWSQSMREGKVVLVHESINALSLDIILQCAFSYKSNCQEKAGDRYATSVQQLCDLGANRFLVLPPLLIISDFLFYYCTPQGWKYRKALREVHSTAENVIKTRRKDLGIMNQDINKGTHQQTMSTDDNIKMAKAAHKNMDFLDVLLTAKDEDGCGLSDIEIRCEVDTFMFEGHDTTASGLTWCLYLLAKHPQHQQKCREEIQNILRGRSHLEYEDISGLKYTHWCIKESLRLYPPVYEFYRKMTQDTDICGYTIPKGAQVCVEVLAIHRNPNVWDNPMVFDPLRFHPDNSANRSPYAFIPFSAGSRNCIGQTFAMNEMSVVIGSILNRFSLVLVEDHKVEGAPVVILRPEDDVKVVLKPAPAPE